MLVIDRICVVDILIDGNPIPDSFNLISSITMAEGNGVLFPACKIIFNDLSGNLTDSLNLTDGNAISITAGKTVNDVGTVTRQYRVFGISSKITPAGPQLIVVGIYDAPAFTTASVREGIRGTSSDVMKQIAQTCQLEYDGPGVQTNDTQAWLNVCRNRASFVLDVTRRGYISPHSGMCSTLTSLGVLKYKDLLTVIEQEPKYTLFHNVPDAEPKGKFYLVKQARDSSKSGMMNTWQNYGSTKVIHSLSGTDVIEDKLEVKSSGKYLAINQQVSDTVKRAKVEHSPLDCSNVHDKYERALYQNIRLLGLFVEKISVLITEPTDMQLLDTVYYRQADADLSKAAEPTDIYVVFGKTVFVRGSASYAERLELIRMSVTNKGKAPLATQDPSSLREASLPTSYVNPTIFTAAGTASLVSLVAGLFSSTTTPTQAAYAALSQMGTFVGASSLQLDSLVGMLNSGGISQHPDKAVVALQLANTPSRFLSNTITTIADSYGLIDDNLANALTQLESLPADQQQSINRAGLTQASLFSPAGPMTSLAMSLPLLKSIAQVSSVYASIQKHLNANTEVLTNADPLAAGYLTEFNYNADVISSKYASLSTSTNNIWNKAVAVTNNKPIPSDLYNYSDHTQMMDELAIASLQTPPGHRYKVTPLNSTVNTMSDKLQSLDASNRNMWMYPAATIARTNRFSADALPDALGVMNKDAAQLDLITRENTIG